MATLTERMMKTGAGVILSDSRVFKDKDVVRTSLPMFNIACSGDITGGYLEILDDVIEDVLRGDE